MTVNNVEIHYNQERDTILALTIEWKCIQDTHKSYEVYATKRYDI